MAGILQDQQLIIHCFHENFAADERWKWSNFTLKERREMPIFLCALGE